MRLFAKPAKKPKKEEDSGKVVDAIQSRDATGDGDGEEEKNIAKSFDGFGFSRWLLDSLREMGLKRPTPVQSACIPQVMAGKDVLAEAPTGTGKTAAFALPILENLARDPFGVFALVLTPTRELAAQIADQFRALGARAGARVHLVIGGVDTIALEAELFRRPHIVVSTPGKLCGIATSAAADGSFRALFRNTRFVVFDEADRLLDPKADAFVGAWQVLSRSLPAPRSGSCQYGLYTATATPLLKRKDLPLAPDAFLFTSDFSGPIAQVRSTKSPKAPSAPVAAVAAAAAVPDAAPGPEDPVGEKRLLKPIEACAQRYLFVPEVAKEAYLVFLLREHSSTQAIVFASSCRRAELAHQILATLKLRSVSLHSRLKQREREAALNSFRSGLAKVLVATDVASRGLDIPEVDLVINYDLPTSASDYVHRIGRTARAGRRGTALAIVTPGQVPLLHRVEAAIGKRLEEHPIKEDDVLFHLSEATAAREIAELYLEQTQFDEKKASTERSFKRHRADSAAAFTFKDEPKQGSSCDDGNGDQST